MFHRLHALWTPTVLVLDPSGAERRRIEGYLPRDEFLAELHLGLARVHFERKQWAEAERLYEQVIEQFPETAAAPEAIYWRGVSRYKRTNDHLELPKITEALQPRYGDTVWAKKASVWRA